MVQVREVETRTEDAPAGVARMADDGAADHAHLHLGVEQGQVDRDLGGRKRVAVLGVQVAVVPDLEVRRAPAALEVRPAEIGDAGRPELVETRERRLGRSQHRPDEVRPAARRREHEREEHALRELDALLVGQSLRPLDGHLLARRDEPRKALGGGVDELLVADGPLQIVGQRGVDGVRVDAEELRSRGIELLLAVGERAYARPTPSRSLQASASRNSAARSPIMIDGAFVLPVVTIGIIDASATRRPSMPCTRSRGSTTAAASVPILHVPT